MWRVSDLNFEEKLRFEGIVNMSVTYSGMLRNFKEGSKEKLSNQLMKTAESLFNVTSEKQFAELHSEFCLWGTSNILVAERRRKEKSTKHETPASYGQIAKALDVALKIAVYYCQLPDSETSTILYRFLYAPVDVGMMKGLQEKYPEDIRPWPVKLSNVQKEDYLKIQELVHRDIIESHRGLITPAQYSDVYWKKPGDLYK